MIKKKTSQDQTPDQKTSEEQTLKEESLKLKEQLLQLQQENFQYQINLLAKDQEQTNIMMLTEMARLKSNLMDLSQTLDKLKGAVNDIGIILSEQEEEPEPEEDAKE